MAIEDTNPSRPGPDRAVVIFDGDCGFCRRSMRLARRITGARVEYVALQSVECAERFPQLPRGALEESVHLVEPDGRVSRGAEAVVRSLAANPRFRVPSLVYARSRPVAAVMEMGYRFVSRHRDWFGRITRPFFRDEGTSRHG